MLHDLLAAYCRARTLAPGSRQQLAIATRQFERWYLEYRGRPPRPADLDRDALHDWMDALNDTGRAAPTINSKRAALLSLANFAADAGLTEPTRRVKRMTEGEDPPTAWSLAEFERLLWSARAEPGDWSGVPAGVCWEFGLLCIWDTGARFHELWAATTAHLNLTDGTWLVPATHRKGRRRGRLYHLAADTCAAIGATLDTPRERLWPFPYGRRQVWVHWDRILDRAGLPTGRRFKWHCVRRTAESHAAAERGPSWAAEAVGHTEAVARRHYLAPSIFKTPTLADCLPRPTATPRLSVFAG